MIQTILQKCLDELKSENPDLSYIRGMLEVLLASQEKPLPILEKFRNDVDKIFDSGIAQMKKPNDEASALDSLAASKLNEVKKLAEKSSE